MRQVLNKLTKKIDSKTYLQIMHKYHSGNFINFKNPKTFTDKINWLKINCKNDAYKDLVDKLEVRKYISESIGSEYLVPLINVYNSVEEIDWNILPDKFVLKCTHGSGCNIVCEDKKNLDIEESEKKIEKWMKRNWYWYGREQPYKYIKPKIIIEEYLESYDKDHNELKDYKFYCFNGNPKYCQVISDRFSDKRIDFYDKNWSKMDFTGLAKGSAKSDYTSDKPSNFDKMLQISSELSSEFSFVRIDLYSINKTIYFGEFTFYPNSGFGKFEPPQYNEIIGSQLSIPDKIH